MSEYIKTTLNLVANGQYFYGSDSKSLYIKIDANHVKCIIAKRGAKEGEISQWSHNNTVLVKEEDQILI